MTTCLPALRLRRRMVLAAFTLATLAVLSGFVFGTPVAKRHAFELPENPVFQADERARESLPSPDHSYFMFVGGRDKEHRGNVLEPAVLKELVRRSDRVMADQRISRYFAPRLNPLVGHPTSGPWGFAETLRDVMNHNSPLIPWSGPSFEDAGSEDLQQLLDLLLDPRRPYRSYFSADLGRDEDGNWSATGMLMLVAADRLRLQSAIEAGELEGLEQFEAWVDSYYQAPFPGQAGSKVHTWSFAALNTQIEAQVDQTLPLIGVAFVVMNLLVALFFRNWRDLLAVFISLVLLMSWVAGAQAWLGYPATQLSSMVPILILALGVDFYFHSLQRWRRLTHDHPQRFSQPALAEMHSAWRTIRGLTPALVLATVTTAIAFGTAVFSPIPDLKEWGVLAVIAILSAYLLLGIFAIILRSGFSPQVPPGGAVVGAPRRALYHSLAMFHQRRGPVAAAMILLATAGIVFVGQPDADFDARDYLDPNSRIVRTLDMERATFPDSGEPGFLLIEGAQLATPETMKAIEEFVEALPEIGALFESGLAEPTVLDLIRLWSLMAARSPARHASFDDADADGLPDTEAGLMAALEQIHEHGVRDHLDPAMATRAISAAEAAKVLQIEDGKLIRTRVSFKVVQADDWPRVGRLKAELERISASLRHRPGLEVTITGPSYVRYAYVNDLTRSFRQSTIIAIVLCAAVLLLALRCIRSALLTLLPVLVVAVWLQAIMVIAGMSLNVVTVQVIGLAIGLGIDYSIHITQRMRDARQDHPSGTPVEWMEQTLSETGLALFGSSCTTLIGFLILLFSPMPLFTMFGTIMSVMIALTMVSSLVLLPPLLMRFGNQAPAKRYGR